MCTKFWAKKERAFRLNRLKSGSVRKTLLGARTDHPLYVGTRLDTSAICGIVGTSLGFPTICRSDRACFDVSQARGALSSRTRNCSGLPGKDGAVAKCLTRASCHFPHPALHDGNVGSSPQVGCDPAGQHAGGLICKLSQPQSRERRPLAGARYTTPGRRPR